ncbi:UbiA family prenyltransferase [Micromonospora sp. BRA006-A]|nr:UbiA family prenyltransferase [Micromonospora sp. BRA006-A]
MRALRAHVETWRPYTLWYVGLVGLAGAAVAGGRHDPWLLLSAWAAPTAGWLGGHYLGDYFDRDLDAGSKPHRPIPSSRLRAGTALWCGSACFAALGVLAVLDGWGTTLAALLAGCGIVAYSRWFKARGIAGNLVRGALGAVALGYGARRRDRAGPRLGGTGAARARRRVLVARRDVQPGRRAARHRRRPRRRLPHAAGGARRAGGRTDRGGALRRHDLRRGDRRAVAGTGTRMAYLATVLVVLATGVVALAPLVARRDGCPSGWRCAPTRSSSSSGSSWPRQRSASASASPCSSRSRCRWCC